MIATDCYLTYAMITEVDSLLIPLCYLFFDNRGRHPANHTLLPNVP